MGRESELLESDQPLCETYDLAMLDLDGVVYIGREAVPNVAENLASTARRGMSLAYVTNNASRPPAAVAAHLQELGLEATPEDVVTSAQAAARLVAERVAPGSAEGVDARAADVAEPVQRLRVFGPDARELGGLRAGRVAPDRVVLTASEVAVGDHDSVCVLLEDPELGRFERDRLRCADQALLAQRDHFDVLPHPGTPFP